jgi:hypothetical protein
VSRDPLIKHYDVWLLATERLPGRRVLLLLIAQPQKLTKPCIVRYPPPTSAPCLGEPPDRRRRPPKNKAMDWNRIKIMQARVLLG